MADRSFATPLRSRGCYLGQKRKLFRRGSYSEQRSSQVFAHRADIGGSDFLGRDLPADDHLAIRLDMANGSLGLLADDCRYLRTLGVFLIMAARNSVERLSLF